MLEIALSAREEVLSLSINTDGNRGANSFLVKTDESVNVKCLPLLKVLTDNNVNKVAAAKFDIEGFEFTVLEPFFIEAPIDLYPKYIIVEHHPNFENKAGGNTIELLQEVGYRIYKKLKTRNYIMILKS